MNVPYPDSLYLMRFLRDYILYRFVWYSGAAERDMRREPARPSAAVKYRWITLQ